MATRGTGKAPERLGPGRLQGVFSIAGQLHAGRAGPLVQSFALQETSLPVATDAESDSFAESMLEQMGEVYPYLAELTRDRVLQPDYQFGAEFEFGLELILDSLEALRAAEARPPHGA